VLKKEKVKSSVWKVEFGNHLGRHREDVEVVESWVIEFKFAN
jgi:hypothetical protein